MSDIKRHLEKLSSMLGHNGVIDDEILEIVNGPAPVGLMRCDHCSNEFDPAKQEGKDFPIKGNFCDDCQAVYWCNKEINDGRMTYGQ